MSAVSSSESPSQTVWIGAVMDPESVIQLKKALLDAGLPPMRDENPHCTLMYSKSVPGIKHIQLYAKPIEASHSGWEVLSWFKSNPETQGGVLTMRFECNELEERHIEEMKNPGATWEHSGGVKPHTSLSAWCTKPFLDSRLWPLLNFKVKFIGEEIEIW